jgi:uncharacterized HAD superfamily protein
VHLGVDFDDVLYPYHRFLKERLHRRYGIDLSQRRVTTFYYDLLPEFVTKRITRDQVWAEVRETWKEVETHAQAPLLDPQAAPVIRALRRRHRVTIVTARHDDALGVIRAFLKRHGIEPHDIVVGRHEKTGFDVLVDDFPAHAVENAQAGGHSLLYTIDENSTFDETRHPRVRRVASWTEVREAVEALSGSR